MKKLTLKRKLEIIMKVRDGLKPYVRSNFLCNDIVKTFDKHSYFTLSQSINFLEHNFNELYDYKPVEVRDKGDSWFDSGRITERLLIVNDLIYRYETALKQKKSVAKIKSKYVPLPYKY